MGCFKKWKFGSWEASKYNRELNKLKILEKVRDLSTKPKICKVCTVIVNSLKNQQKETICRVKPQARQIP
jgi:hypothetical protein